ncbi:tRNA (adenosine(37)-N6)-threonylcarbamoyltransferase complex dimerization subunit type 1 TsaB [SAR202 cluster bacterium AD-802-E10_MRT_200m]|nr:tRNA (adenosine(37)-N6)-threonylcarbamoyltransferase complex dimerization subunit type 1 TsaB [SAR202 cluster bacterium AD-802-E10_MRT_200m]MQF83100.1 tRNA (adenosine(37)-N6)-threonylcarbamoyltransferase complex dimerization subunit type 1 TsaB [SAR202 cluster bacterium AD-802-E10_MRT_200m]
MLELSIDTSTRYASVCLSEKGQAIWEINWHSSQNHTIELTPAIASLFQKADVAPKQLNSIFLALGPGGFSALRVGMSVAKGMAEALNIPILGIGTLEIEAMPFSSSGLPIVSVVEMGKSDIAWGVYEGSKKGLTCLRGEEVSAPEKVIATAPKGSLICGEGAKRLLPFACSSNGKNSTIFHSEGQTRHASCLAQLGYIRFSDFPIDNTIPMEPLYLKTPNITPPKPKGRRV